MTHNSTKSVSHGVMLSVLCVISYWVITHLLARVISISRDDDLLGGMWAVVATVFVYRCGYEETIRAALSRVSATLLSFALCFLYLLFLPFNMWGMAMLIGIGAIVMIWLSRPDDVTTTGITTAVVMVVAGISSNHAWKHPVLRVVDTLVGVGTGVIGSAFSSRFNKQHKEVQ